MPGSWCLALGHLEHFFLGQVFVQSARQPMNEVCAGPGTGTERGGATLPPAPSRQVFAPKGAVVGIFLASHSSQTSGAVNPVSGSYLPAALYSRYEAHCTALFRLSYSTVPALLYRTWTG